MLNTELSKEKNSVVATGSERLFPSFRGSVWKCVFPCSISPLGCHWLLFPLGAEIGLLTPFEAQGDQLLRSAHNDKLTREVLFPLKRRRWLRTHDMHFTEQIISQLLNWF